MFSELIGLIKMWLIARALANPVLWILGVILFTVILLVSAIFIRFKNGWISVVCFLLLETLSIIAVTSLATTKVYSDDLRLDKGTVVACTEVNSSGVVVKRRFRAATVPLLGLELPENDSKYLDAARDYILQSRFSGSFYLHYSSVYPGVVIYDSSFNSINEGLLKRGLARTTAVAPQQYVRLQKEAVKAKRGVWEIASYSPKKSYILEYSTNWLVFINSVCVALVVTVWLKRIIVRHKLQVSFLTDQK